jgi:hypothetical protein
MKGAHFTSQMSVNAPFSSPASRVAVLINERLRDDPESVVDAPAPISPGILTNRSRILFSLPSALHEF